MMRSEVVTTTSGQFEVLRSGEARPRFFVLPGAVGGISAYADFIEGLCAADLIAAGVNPRGCGGSTGPLEDVTLGQLAADIASVIQTIGDSPAIIIGHAGGNRIARMVATWHPEMVRGVVLLAAGGAVPPSAEAVDALQRVAADSGISEAERIELYAAYFLAPANEHLAAEGAMAAPDSSGEFGAAFGRALAQVPAGEWLGGGNAPMLVLQGLQDQIAPPANGHLLAEQYPERVEVFDIDDAGHGLFLEQPTIITEKILDWLLKIPSAAPD